MILENLKSPALLALALCMSLAQTGFGQDEYDDMYFSSKDRKKIKYAQETTEANITYESYSNNTYNNPSYSAKEVNPEYIEKYKQQASASVANELAAAEGDTNPTYSSQDYFVEGAVDDYDNPSFYNDPKYNRQNESTVVNNYYGSAYNNPYSGGFNSYGPSMMMSYNNWGGWSYGISYGFGWGNGYYNPYYDPFYCPMYSYNSYRWYNNGYNQGFYNGYNYGYYASGGVDAGYQRQVTRGARGSRGQTAAGNPNIVRYSSATPARNSSREATALNSRTSASTRVATTTSSNGRLVSNSNNQVQSQNEYLRKAKVSTSRSRLTDLSNRTSSRSTVSSRTTYAGGSTRVSSNLNGQSNNLKKTPAISTRSTRSANSSRSSSGNVRRYNTQRTSYSNPNNSYSGTRTSAPSRSYATPSRSSSGSRNSSGRSSGSSSRSSSRGRR